MTKTMKVEGPLHVVCQCDKCNAQPEQKPVAWMSDRAVGFRKSEFGAIPTVPLYTTPPTAQRKPLTDEQITEIYTKWEATKGTSWADLMRAIEAAHGIKEQK